MEDDLLLDLVEGLNREHYGISFAFDEYYKTEVEIEPVDTDRYGRTLAFVQVENITVNEELIKEGLAWVYKRYCKLPVCNDSWDGLELEAKSGKRGLWGQSVEIPPWEYRRQKRKYAAQWHLSMQMNN